MARARNAKPSGKSKKAKKPDAPEAVVTSGEDTPQKQNLSPAWKPGQSGNPKGRPKGARSRLSEFFLTKLEEDFREHGVKAIQDMRTEKPVEYVKIVAAVVPKAFDLGDDGDGDGQKIVGVALVTRAAIESIIERGRADGQA